MSADPDAAPLRPSARVLVVLPTYNEALNLPHLIPRLMAVDEAVDCLVVDDSSPDGSADVAEALAREYEGRLTVIRRGGKAGRGSAVMEGFRRSLPDERYALFGEMDADLSHQPEEVPRLIAAAADADLVVGARYIPGGRIEGWSSKRKIWSAMSNRIIHAVIGVPMTDFTNGYRLYSRRAVKVLTRTRLRESGFISLSEWALAIHRAGLTIREVPTHFINRRFGVSNMSAAEAIGALRALLRMRMTRPPRQA
jgi:dolichol-phosphate mannosyltransferase